MVELGADYSRTSVTTHLLARRAGQRANNACGVDSP